MSLVCWQEEAQKDDHVSVWRVCGKGGVQGGGEMVMSIASLCRHPHHKHQKKFFALSMTREE
jgi:hypothetical protein